MKRRNIILLIGMLIIPFAALIWVVQQASANEQIAIEKRFQELLQARLSDVDKNICLFFEEAARDLERITAIDTTDIAELRKINRKQPRLMQLFVLNPDANLIYPDPTQSYVALNGTERVFLIEAAKMFTGQDLKEAILRAEQQESPPAQSVQPQVQQLSLQTMDQVPNSGNLLPQLPLQQTQNWQKNIVADAYTNTNTLTNQKTATFEGSKGWFQWYWDRGINLIYWQRRPNGNIVGAVLERARWMADLIAQLPDTMSNSSQNRTDSPSTQTNIRLVSSGGTVVYQWGSFEPDSTQPFCDLRVCSPLTSWQLQCFAPIDQLTQGTGRSAQLSLLAVMVAVGSLICVGGMLFVKDYLRDIKEAEQQVSFVNQVSHEFKTPLTNIRMYAELLQQDLTENTDTDPHITNRLSIIVSEGQRLSRLINNVLTFARQRRKTITLHPVLLTPDKLISTITDRFRPALEEAGVEIELQLNAQTTLQLDPDFVEQILGNLLSNVEKYASAGGQLTVSSCIDNTHLSIEVADSGPGIPTQQRKRIFLPFQRLSHELSYAAGTGIGLPIARELAQLHGGDVVLLESHHGCCFRMTLKSASENFS